MTIQLRKQPPTQLLPPTLPIIEEARTAKNNWFLPPHPSAFAATFSPRAKALRRKNTLYTFEKYRLATVRKPCRRNLTTFVQAKF
jgi:hypothetical protein